MNQRNPNNSASNEWEADPWDASDALADIQLVGFKLRVAKPIAWSEIRTAGPSVFGVEVQKLIGADAEFYATHDGENMLLMQKAWHGFPDPPEWQLVSRPVDAVDQPWQSWGHFAHLPFSWLMPSTFRA